LDNFRKNQPEDAEDYCKKTWCKYKELLVAAWVDEYEYFGHTATSRVEGAHSCLKATLRVSTMDLYATYHRMTIFWNRQLELHTQRMEDSRTSLSRKAQHPLFARLVGQVTPYALNKVIGQHALYKKHLEGPPPPRVQGLYYAVREVLGPPLLSPDRGL
jgi:hypothetical protein